MLHERQQPHCPPAQEAPVQMAIRTPPIQVLILIYVRHIRILLVTICFFKLFIESNRILCFVVLSSPVTTVRVKYQFFLLASKVQGARRWLHAAAADPLRERGANGAADEGEADGRGQP